MAAIWPSTVAPEDYVIGDNVRKWVSQSSVSPFIGVVTDILPSIAKVDVQWPVGNVREDPETLIKINPVFGLPSVKTDTGYSSYDKSISENYYGRIPPRKKLYRSSAENMSIRIAHTFSTKVIGLLVEDLDSSRKKGLSDVQAYNKVYRKYSDTCSDHIIRFSVSKVYNG